MNESRVPDILHVMPPLSYRGMDFEEFCAAAISTHQLEALQAWEQIASIAFEYFEQERNRAIMVEEIARVKGRKRRALLDDSQQRCGNRKGNSVKTALTERAVTKFDLLQYISSLLSLSVSQWRVGWLAVKKMEAPGLGHRRTFKKTSKQKEIMAMKILRMLCYDFRDHFLSLLHSGSLVTSSLSEFFNLLGG
ncbi:hypothetical protein Nepgr_002297 [Nepenthes gracilis]|uniref:Uncharacterized protein n=1 Tax=Nepenthes gracilis TaxID=150966 RepID=A0AAD3P8M0_NEPGR|nr:hypothetical protein Nepgr_002297 [Nepenthes gracilis]